MRQRSVIGSNVMKKSVLIVAPLLALAVLAGAVFLREVRKAELPASVAQRADERLPAPSQPLPLAGSESAVAVDGLPAASLADCVAALTSPESSSQLMAEQRRLRIANFLEEQGNALEQELAADIAGYRRDTERPGDGGLPIRFSWAYVSPEPFGKRKLTAGEQRRLANRLDEAGVEGLIALDAPALLQARWDDTSLVGHLIREHGEALYAALPAAEGALPVGLHELAIAIEEGVALASFVVLADHANSDLSERWWNGANLAKVAAIHGRPDILRYLMSNGVDPTVDRAWGRDASVLDDIASLPERPNKAPLAEVVEQLIAAGDHPYLPSTLTTLGQWLPDVSLPPLHPDAAAALPSVADAARAVAEMDAEWTTKVESATLLEERCKEQLAAGEQAAEMFHGTDLASKQRHLETLEVRQERWLEELAKMADAANDGVVEEDSAHWADVGTRLVEATTEGRWQEAIAIADQQGRNFHLALLDIALRSDAPVEVLLALTSRHRALPDEAIAYLAGNRREDVVEVVLALEPFGLDIHHVDELGHNAFHVLAGLWGLDEESRWRLAEFLASRNVSVKPSAMGLDPLDHNLMKLLQFPQWGSQARIRFARFLIDHGAPVEPSHFQLAESLSQISEETYRRLVRVVPEVAS